jgi:hypothetical protein
MSRSASKVMMEALHKALAETFNDLLTNGRTVIDKETGEALKVPPDASTLNAVRQFLKDNGIEANAEDSDELKKLARKALPFPTQTDEYGLPQ